MTFNGIVQIVLFCVVIIALVRPFGLYMTRVFEGEPTFLSPIIRPVERLLYWLAGVDVEAEQDWLIYGTAMLIFNLASALLLYAILRLQDRLPFNPQGIPALSPELALNTAVSFVTNTNWQFYSGESQMSYFTQMLGLTVHNFVSAATGVALAMALIRGFARRSARTIGNFWVDLTRCTLYVLLPVSILAALFMVWQGVPQTMEGYPEATTLEGAKQVIAVGPVASQEAIKMFGTNGGGFFNANSAHPYENPNPLTNFIQIILIFAIPAGLTYTLGRMTGSQKHGWAVWSAMAALFLAGVICAYTAESRGNPLLHGTDQKVSATQPGGNMEGKEIRFGIANSALFATVTTDASCGAINGQHDSFTPLGGMIPLINMMLGEVVF